VPSNPTPSITYDRTANGEAQFWEEIHGLTASGAKRICDVGGGAKPIISLEQVRELGLEYIVLDESEDELGRAPEGYVQVHASILDREAIARLVAERGQFDAVISRWTAEHVPDGRLFHEQVLSMLRPGGIAVHYFPTLYSLPFVVNRILSPAQSSAILFRVYPSRKAKFRPYYSWCRGPSARQLSRLTGVGFEIKRYTGYFGHGFYRSVPPVHRAQQRLSEWLVDHPVASMTSFALVSLRKP